LLAPSCNDCFTERQAVMATTRHIRTYFLSEQLNRDTARKKFHSLLFVKSQTSPSITCRMLFVRSFASPSVSASLALLSSASDLICTSIYVYNFSNVFFLCLQYQEKYQKKKTQIQVLDWLINRFRTYVLI
jgi:hypothetical protein